MRQLFLFLLAASILGTTSCDNLMKSKKEEAKENNTTSDKETGTTRDSDRAEDSRSPDDDRETVSGTDRSESSEGWAVIEKRAFMDKCVTNAATGLGDAKAEEYCDCMMKKLQAKYPKATDMVNLKQEEVVKMAPSCL